MPRDSLGQPVDPSVIDAIAKEIRIRVIPEIVKAVAERQRFALQPRPWKPKKLSGQPASA